MNETRDVLESVRKALRSEDRVKIDQHPLHLAFAAGDLTMEGEAPDIAAKKLALERAAAVAGVDHIVDRIRVAPAERMGDKQIRDHVRNALVQEPAFAEIGLRVHVKGAWETVRDPAGRRGTIDVRVEDGVVTLAGDVPGLAHKRLAGVLAWWVPGSRDVVNGLAVTPPEADNDEEIADAVRLVLEKDPFVDASQIRVSVRHAVVTLDGLVPGPAHREMAEFDAWYVFAVDKVVNRIAVRP
ncbi:MAG: BON domain-containing protein [Alphaproteobacteria bacterium]|nr:BON domain-containing protein [Alphaproteobacteria bacterium]